MAEPAPERSWWTTLPGILTGAAALLTAVSGLLVALVQIGNGRSEAGRPDPPGPDIPQVVVPAPGPPGTHTTPTGSPGSGPVAPDQRRTASPAPVTPAPLGRQGGPPPLTLGEPLTIADTTLEVVSIESSSPRGDLNEIRVTFRATAGATGLRLWRENVRILTPGRIHTPREGLYTEELRPGTGRQFWVRFEIAESISDAVLSFTDNGPSPRGEVRRALPGP